jgi:beta-lactamase regulating signal transducer with metallopeptidase domain
MLHYILQTIAFQLFFLIIYDAFLKKETFFNWNRAYLLLTALLSIALPFIKIQSFKNVVPKEFVMAMPEVTIGNISEVDANLATQIVTTEASKFQMSWELLFYIGAFVALAMFMLKLLKIVSLIYKNPKYWSHNLRIVTLLKSNTAFSFFYYVFLGEQINEEDKLTILKHETVHVNQKHTLDLLFFELLRIVFWFNPLVYMYQSRISSLHEFIADAEAVKSRNKNDYYQDLLNQIFETKNVSFINAFYKKSLIKKRIVMLSKAKSKQTQLIKYALLIPMVFVMVLYSSSYAQENNKTQSLSVTQTQDPIEVPFATVEEVPMLPGCENFGTQNERRDCIANKISAHVQKNFNTKLAGNLGLSGKQRISVIFKIDTNGDVVGVRSRAPHPDLETEAIRVINTLPQFTPGKQNGEKVVVPYSLPIIFEVKEGAKVKLSDLQKANLRPVEIIETQDLSNLTEVPFAVIEQVPTFPGCEHLTDQKELRKCMADSITKFVQKKFNTDLAKESGLTGRQRINVVFKIDSTGNITGIRSRAPHPNLEDEAERVIGMLPKMIPGEHKGKKVIVPYSLPIIFQVGTSAASASDSNKTKGNPNIEEVMEVQDLSKNNGIPFAVIDKVPTFPECESLSTNDAQKKCVSDKIIKYVQKNFNTGLAKDLGLKGRQQISTIFKIDTNGNVAGIQSRAANQSLAEEAKRVIGMLPKFIPGEHKGEKVNVSYSLPIVFQVNE